MTRDERGVPQSLGPIHDYRKTGVAFPEEELQKPEARQAAQAIADEFNARTSKRAATLGYWIQPVPPYGSHAQAQPTARAGTS